MEKKHSILFQIKKCSIILMCLINLGICLYYAGSIPLTAIFFKDKLHLKLSESISLWILVVATGAFELTGFVGATKESLSYTQIYLVMCYLANCIAVYQLILYRWIGFFVASAIRTGAVFSFASDLEVIEDAKVTNQFVPHL